jgi:transposase
MGRRIFEAILFMLHKGMKWRFLPKSFPPESTVHDTSVGGAKEMSFEGC